jgi:hypothetical protein
MRSEIRVCLSALLVVLSCTLIPAGKLFAQQTAGAPASSPSPQEMDQLTGPIALYPDALVFQIVAASANVGAVQSFAGWLEKNAALKGSELQNAAQKAGFDAALVALAPFPQVVGMMAQKPDWTKALGQADKNALFDSIQRLRAQAMAVGNLKTTSQQTVETQTTTSGQQVIVIQPANPQVIYVPVYNTQTVYVQQAPPPSSANAAGAALVGFTVGVIVGANNSYYHHYDDYWDHREDYYQERQDNFQQNQDQRQSNAQANQDQRQSTAQANQDQRQSTAQANQGQRQPTAQANQSQRQSAAPTAQAQGSASKPPGQPAAAPSSRGGGQTASKSSGMSYQSGSTTKAQSSRGSASRSASRGGGRSGGRSGGGRGR